jgi:hypothetical protein
MSLNLLFIHTQNGGSTLYEFGHSELTSFIGLLFDDSHVQAYDFDIKETFML